MKQSLRTAKDIFIELTRLHQEGKELREACDAIADELGDDHIGYILLKKQYDEKLQEVRSAENVKFVQADSIHGGETPLFGSLPPGVK